MIDQKAVYKVIYIDLQQPYGVLEDMEAYEVSWLIEGNLEAKEDYYEMISYAVKNAMVSVNKGKDYRLFEDKRNKNNSKLTQQKREEEIAQLVNTFGKL